MCILVVECSPQLFCDVLLSVKIRDSCYTTADAAPCWGSLANALLWATWNELESFKNIQARAWSFHELLLPCQWIMATKPVLYVLINTWLSKEWQAKLQRHRKTFRLSKTQEFKADPVCPETRRDWTTRKEEQGLNKNSHSLIKQDTHDY